MKSGILQKCKKWHIMLNLTTRGGNMVGQKFRHASSMGQGNLGQSWRNLRTREKLFFSDKTSPCTIDCALKHMHGTKRKSISIVHELSSFWMPLYTIQCKYIWQIKCLRFIVQIAANCHMPIVYRSQKEILVPVSRIEKGFSSHSADGTGCMYWRDLQWNWLIPFDAPL